MAEKNGNKKRGARGLGRLYKRVGSKEYRADSNIQGNYWLEYTVKVEGERFRRREALYTEAGEPITKREDAELAREIKIAQNKAKTKADLKEKYLRELQSDQEKLDAAREAVELAANPALKIKGAWVAYKKSDARADADIDTIYNYESQWMQFENWILSRREKIVCLNEVTPALAKAYASYLKTTKQVSDNTHNKHVIFLKQFFNVLADEARIKENPFGAVKLRRDKTAHSRRELSRDELRSLITNATGELEGLVMLGIFTGLRLGDCCTIKWSEINLSRGFILRVPNKSRQMRGKKAKPVKIGIPAPLFAYLSAFPESDRRGYVLPDYAEKYSYRKTDTQKPVRRTMVTNDVRRLFEACGIQTHAEGTGYQMEPDPARPGKMKRVYTGRRAVVDVGFHSLRHTYVSLQAEAGTPQSVVQAIVGHANPAMTDHYTHVGEAAALAAARKMDVDIIDADFEVLPDPAVRVAEVLRSATAADWEDRIREALGILEGAPAN